MTAAMDSYDKLKTYLMMHLFVRVLFVSISYVVRFI